MADKKHTVKINFDNKEAAKGFLTWLCEQGEQDYWTWQECREQEETGDITATNFDYWVQSKKEFAKGLEVNAHCGRLDMDADGEGFEGDE
jgi:hypothetical protein